MMKIDLYPCFKHLLEYQTIWLYSDPHFGDEKMMKARKKYIGDEEQIKRINAKVGKKDVIIFLGDIGDATYIKKIKGYKILILGNHDKGKSNYQRTIINDIDNHLFDEIYEGIVTLNDKIILSHEPVTFPYAFNIHGHDHSNKINANDGLHLNVCAENIDYAPISLNKLIKDGTFNNVPNIHRNAIDKAIDKKIRENDFINYFDLLTYSNDLPSLVFDNGYECKCIGYISYRDTIYPLYDDDYGAQVFIVFRYFVTYYFLHSTFQPSHAHKMAFRTMVVAEFAARTAL